MKALPPANILESMGDAFVALDTEWRYTYMNQKAGQIFNRRPEDMIGKHIWTEFPEGIGQPFYQAYYKAVETQTPIYLEEYYPPYNRWFENRIYPSADGLAIFFQDITERKQAEQALRESEERLARIVETVPNGITIVNREGQITFANAAAERIFGLRRGGITDRTYDDPGWRITALDGSPFPQEELPFLRVKQSGQPVYGVEHAIEHLDGRRVMLSINAAPLHEAGGGFDGMVAAITNITERKQAEGALRKSEQTFSVIFKKAPFAAALAGLPDGAYMEVNEEFERVFDYSRQELVGKTSLELGIYPDPEVRARSAAMFREQGFVRNLDMRLQTRTGEIRDLLINSDLVEIGGEKYILTTANDITERKRAEEALQKRYQELSAIHEASQRLQKLLSPDLLAHEVIEVLEHTLNYQYGAVLLMDEVSGVLHPFALSAQNQGAAFLEADREYVRSKDVRLGRGVTGWVAEHGETVRLDEVRQDPRYLAVREGIRSELCVPLRVQDRVIGVVNIESPQANAYTADDQRLLETIAVQIAVAIHNTQLLAGERRARQIAETLRLANLSLAQRIDLDYRLSALLESLAELVPYDSANVMLLQDDTWFVPRAHRGYEQFTDPALIEMTAFDALKHPIVGPLLEGKSVLIADAREAPGWEWRAGGEHVRSWMGVPLIAAGKVIGHYSVDKAQPNFFTQHHLELAQALAAQAAVAIENAQLFEETSLGRVRLETLSRRLVEAQEAERRHIARELHDEIGQAFTALKLNLQSLERAPAAAGLGPPIQESIGIVEHAIQQVRNLSVELRPSLLDDLGLIPALRWHLDRYTQRTGTAVHFTADPATGRPPPEIETVCFRVTQEALTNVARHAQARQAWVDLRQSSDELRLTIRDDGTGFDARAARARAARGGSFGLLGMEERVLLIGGKIEIDSGPGKGTEIRISFPLADEIRQGWPV